MHKIICPNQAYGIIGLAKNTGKTTTLNHIIGIYKDQPIAMTSIGLDGEPLDQIFKFPKPSIMVYQGHIIATANNCLKELSGFYDVIEDTDIMTPLGNVMIIKMKRPTTILLAGPSTNKEMDSVINKLKKQTGFVLVDGAFNRMTFSSLKALDGIILTTGASFHENMEITLMETKKIIRHFQFPKTDSLDYHQKPVIIKTKTKTICLAEKNLALLTKTLDTIKEHITSIYIKGAVTPNIMHIIMRRQDKHFKWILDDATKLLIPFKYHTYIDEMDIRFEVIHHIKLQAITINPFSPKGYTYDMKQFEKELKRMTDLPVINIKKEDVTYGTFESEQSVD